MIDGSDTLLVNKWSCSLAAGCWGTALWSEEEEDRLSVLRADVEEFGAFGAGRFFLRTLMGLSEGAGLCLLVSPAVISAA